MIKLTERRRDLRAFRTELLLTSLTVVFCFALIVTISIFAPIAALMDRTDMVGPEAAGLAQYFLTLHASVWPMFAISVISCIVSALVLYRRMTSPLVRFWQVLAAVGAGGPIPAPITIRATDYLSAECNELNEMLESLAVRRAAQLAATKSIRGALEGVPSSSMSADARRELLDALATLDAYNDREEGPGAP